MRIPNEQGGMGRYDDECEALFKSMGADAVLLIVVNGPKGSGFSVSASSLGHIKNVSHPPRSAAGYEDTAHLSDWSLLLRIVADGIDQQNRGAANS